MKDWILLHSKENTFELLENLLSNGENPQATEIYNALTDSQKREYLEYRYDCFNESFMVSTATGGRITIEEVEEDLLYLINKY